jgi:hypothetical protein
MQQLVVECFFNDCKKKRDCEFRCHPLIIRMSEDIFNLS